MAKTKTKKKVSKNQGLLINKVFLLVILLLILCSLLLLIYVNDKNQMIVKSDIIAKKQIDGFTSLYLKEKDKEMYLEPNDYFTDIINNTEL